MKQVLILFLITFSSCVFSQVRWLYQADGPITGKPVVHENWVYITSGKSLIALDKSGQLVWQYNLNANSYSSVAINKDSIYVLANNDLHALTINGERKWFYPTTDKAKKIEGELWGLEQGMVTDVWSWYRSAPLLIDNKVIFGNAGDTYAISTQNGDVLWHLNTGVTHTKPIVTNNSVVIGSWNKNLYAINHDNGKVKWKFTSTEGFNLDPTVYQGTIYLGNRSKFFYAIDAEKGIEKWSIKQANTWIGSPAIEFDGQVYFGTSDSYSLIGLNAKSGAQKLFALNRMYNFAQPQANKSSIFYGSLSGRLFEVNKKNSKKKLIFETEKSANNYNSIVRKDGGLNAIYAVDGGYTIASLTKEVERMKSELDSILSITLDESVIYAGTANGNLYAISI